MKLLLAFYILTGTINPMEDEYKGYYTIYFEDNRAVEFATQEEVFHYFRTGEFEYFSDDRSKGFNYRKHYRRSKFVRFKNRLFNSNGCKGVSHHA